MSLEGLFFVCFSEDANGIPTILEGVLLGTLVVGEKERLLAQELGWWVSEESSTGGRSMVGGGRVGLIRWRDRKREGLGGVKQAVFFFGYVPLCAISHCSVLLHRSFVHGHIIDWLVVILALVFACFFCCCCCIAALASAFPTYATLVSFR